MWADGFHDPNFVDFAGPRGLVGAMGFSRATADSIRHDLRAGALWGDADETLSAKDRRYLKVERDSHAAILRRLKSIGREWGVKEPFQPTLAPLDAMHYWLDRAISDRVGGPRLKRVYFRTGDGRLPQLTKRIRYRRR